MTPQSGDASVYEEGSESSGDGYTEDCALCGDSLINCDCPGPSHVSASHTNSSSVESEQEDEQHSHHEGDVYSSSESEHEDEPPSHCYNSDDGYSSGDEDSSIDPEDEGPPFHQNLSGVGDSSSEEVEEQLDYNQTHGHPFSVGHYPHPGDSYE